MVAELIEILAPIDQTGWRSAASGVALAISSRLAVRNGPPEAVRMIFSMAPRLPSAMDWKMALCSESQGSRVAPASRTARSITSPAQTSASLLARATHLPRWTAARVGARPAAPVIAAIVQSASRPAASTTASAPASIRMSVPASAARRAAKQAASAMTAYSACSVRACSASSGDVAAADQRPDAEALGRGGQQLHGLGADAAGAAKDGDRALPVHCHRTTPRPSINANIAAASATASSASTRSSKPPCPGMSRPESFTPKRRLA